MDKEDIIKIIRDLNPKIQKRYKADVKAIFGSYVHGSATEDSDLDVLVDFNPDANLLDLVGLSQFLEDNIHVRVDVVPIDSIRKEIEKQVLEEAVLI